MSERIYLAGPMNRYADNNVPGFLYAARMLRAEGHEVFNPGEHGEERLLKKRPEYKHSEKFRRAVYYKDCKFITKRATMICFLPGWEKGRGAQMEHALATALLPFIKIRYLDMKYVKGWIP